MSWKLYDELAGWWPLLSAPADYREEADFYSRALIDACREPPRRVLELGSGGGNNALHMKSRFDLTLVDLSPGMLEVSRSLNPECEHVEGDMRTVRLDRTFDAVFVHDAVVYMLDIADLRSALETAFVHCAPGGVSLFAPDYVRESFAESTSLGGNDDGTRGLRYLAWTWDPNPEDTTYITDYAYLLRDGDGTTRAIHDRHVEGVFPRQTWLDLLTDVGFEARVIAFSHTEVPDPLTVFVARRPR